MQHNYVHVQLSFVNMQHKNVDMQRNLSRMFIISHVDMSMLHTIMLHVEINKSHVNIFTLAHKKLFYCFSTKTKAHLEIS